MYVPPSAYAPGPDGLYPPPPSDPGDLATYVLGEFHPLLVVVKADLKVTIYNSVSGLCQCRHPRNMVKLRGDILADPRLHYIRQHALWNAFD